MEFLFFTIIVISTCYFIQTVEILSEKKITSMVQDFNKKWDQLERKYEN